MSLRIKNKVTLNVEALETRNLMSVTVVGVASTAVLGNVGVARIMPPMNPVPSPAGVAFLNSLSDANVRSAALADFNRDLAITRNDLLDIFAKGTLNYTACSSSAIESLELLVDPVKSKLVLMPEYVQNLGSKVVWNSIAPAYDAGQKLNEYIVSQAPIGKPGAGKTTPNAACQANQYAAARSIKQGVGNYFQGQVLPDASFDYNGVPQQPQWQFINMPLFASGGPNYQDIAQGFTGDCWVMASLAEIAVRNPVAIQNMFIDNGDGTYIVRFYHGTTPDYVTVDNRLPMNPSGVPSQIPRDPYGTMEYPDTLYDHPMTCLWAALAEKAFAQENGAGWINSQHKGVASYQAIYSGYPSDALSVLTGLPTDSSSLITIAGVYENGSAIGKAWSQGKYIVLATSSIASDPIVADHAYALVDVTGGYYKLFNPWGINSSVMFNKPAFVSGDAWAIASEFFYWTQAGSAPETAAAKHTVTTFNGNLSQTTAVTPEPTQGKLSHEEAKLDRGHDGWNKDKIEMVSLVYSHHNAAELDTLDAVFADLFANEWLGQVA